jgi:hypothetical protein
MRVLYNFVLAIFTILVSYQELAEAVAHPSFHVVGLIVVMVFFCFLANLCYCVAYIPDIIFQMTPLDNTWPRFRWALFSTGTVLACVCVVAVLYYPHPM